MTRLGLLLAFLSTVVLANWLVQTHGVVPVGFGLMAPAGVYVVGLAFILRDALHEVDRRLVVVAILVGAVLSLLVADPRLAWASGAAFLLSESLDMAVWVRLRERSYLAGLLTSNAVGIVADSALFLWLAFGGLAFLPGQAVGKAWMTLLAASVLWIVRRRALLPRHA